MKNDGEFVDTGKPGTYKLVLYGEKVRKVSKYRS